MSDTDSALKARITEDMKTAMRSGDKERLGAIRLVLAAIKQVEVDTRETLADPQVVGILDKLAKQRRESISQYQGAGRDDLAAKEQRELELIQEYLPAALSEQELERIIEDALQQSGASGMKDMGRVMAIIKPQAQGRADMGAVSARVKQRLSG
ncbi:MAG: GatB/YqeY domain-containing protein [Chromatiales bacterium]|jgi:uncharacterized protein YqeY